MTWHCDSPKVITEETFFVKQNILKKFRFWLNSDWLWLLQWNDVLHNLKTSSQKAQVIHYEDDFLWAENIAGSNAGYDGEVGFQMLFQL